MIEVRKVDHIGVRVRDLDRAMAFYEALGFSLLGKATNDAVAVLKNEDDVELNLVYNATTDNDGNNILMDVDEKYAGYTHVAFSVDSIEPVIRSLGENGIEITQGPVSFGADGHVSVFVRDPDRNVIEFRGRSEDVSSLEGVVVYHPEN